MQPNYYMVQTSDGYIAKYGYAPNIAAQKLLPNCQLITGDNLQEPNPLTDRWDFTSEQLITNAVTYTPDINLLIPGKVTTLSTQCQQTIESGFQSEALGSVGLYGSKQIDQLNILHAAANTNGGNLRVGDPSNLQAPWPLLSHSQAQAQQVQSDFLTWCDTQRTKLATLTAQVYQATTQQELDAIVWAPGK